MSDQAEVTTEEAAPESIGDALRAAAQEMAREPENEPEPEAPEDQPQPEPEVVPDEASEGDDDAAPDSAPAAADADERPEELKAPHFWTAEEAKLFPTLPREAQEIISRRESVMQKHLTQRQEEIAPVRRFIEENKAYFDRVGQAPEQAMAALVRAEATLRFGTPQQKAAMFQQLQRDYGIGEQDAQQANGREDTDPEVAAAIAPLQQQLEQMRAQQEARDQAARDAQEDAHLRVAAEFLAETTDTGELAHPYVQQVMPQFEAMIALERDRGQPMNRETLERAYVAACRATPAVFDRIQEDTRQAQLRAEAKKKQAAAAKAKKASSGLGGSAGSRATSGNEASTNETVGQTLRRVAQEARAAG